jgi:hypothetical protein
VSGGDDETIQAKACFFLHFLHFTITYSAALDVAYGLFTIYSKFFPLSSNTTTTLAERAEGTAGIHDVV